MANSISISAALSLFGTGINIGLTPSVSQSQVATTGVGVLQQQTIGTSDETLVFTDVVPAGGFLLVYNSDPTNYVEVDSASTYDKFPQKLTAGKFVLLLPQTSTIHAKANTGACSIYYCAVTL